MNDQERQVISDIFRRLEQVANQPRDPEAELAHIPQGMGCDGFQFLKVAPLSTMHLLQIGANGAPFFGSHHIPDVVMPVLGLAPFGTGRNPVTVDVDGKA